MNFTIVALLTLFALAPTAQGRNLGFWRLFDEPDNKCYGIDPKEREDCGYYGIGRDECVHDRGCCFDETEPNVPWCFKGNEEPTEEPIEEDNKCYGIDPKEREDCGYYGIGRDECVHDRGCCFDETEPNVPWCFKGNEEPTEEPIEEDNKCYGIDPKEREDCGYYGIGRDECVHDRGCCFDETEPNVPWCFKGNEEPTEEPIEEDNKCYGIDPKEREDCGYYGIGRDECVHDRGCCFDETEPNVPWCFKGNEEPTEEPTEVSAEESTEGSTEEPAEGSTEEPAEGSTEEPAEGSTEEQIEASA